MLYSGKSSLKGKYWLLPGGQWKACNLDGKQTIFREQYLAIQFAATGKSVAPKPKEEKKFDIKKFWTDNKLR